MKTLNKLFLGEVRRMISYKILPVSLVTCLLWIILFFLLSKQEAASIAPLLLFTDVAMMSILLIGASHHLERQEGTIRSMLVMPVGIGQIVAAKIMASFMMSLQSAVVTCAALYFIHGVTLNYGLLLLAVILSGAAHAAIGFSLSLFSRDFSSLLGLLSLYILLFALPSILLTLNIIPKRFDWLLILSPSHAAQIQLSAAFGPVNDVGKLLASLGYLAVLTVLLLLFHVNPGFRRHAVRG